jgi:hypothetical protein
VVDRGPEMLIRLKMARVLAIAALFAAASAYGGALERIRDKGEITLGYVIDAAPFSSSDANKQPQGYSVDICREGGRDDALHQDQTGGRSVRCGGGGGSRLVPVDSHPRFSRRSDGCGEYA